MCRVECNPECRSIFRTVCPHLLPYVSVKLLCHKINVTCDVISSCYFVSYNHNISVGLVCLWAILPKWYFLEKDLFRFESFCVCCKVWMWVINEASWCVVAVTKTFLSLLLFFLFFLLWLFRLSFSTIIGDNLYCFLYPQLLLVMLVSLKVKQSVWPGSWSYTGFCPEGRCLAFVLTVLLGVLANLLLS